MRIDAYNQVNQVYKANQSIKAKKATNPKSGDKVEISSIGRDIQIAKQAVSNSPDVREEVVATLKKKIDAGDYEVDAQAFAEKLLNNLNNL